jgi:hypothetical protein
MQVPARVRDRHVARLHRVLEMMVTAARADEAPSVRLKLADDITRILAPRTPQLRLKVAQLAATGKNEPRLSA